jgi:hypothetical protein
MGTRIEDAPGLGRPVVAPASENRPGVIAPCGSRVVKPALDIGDRGRPAAPALAWPSDVADERARDRLDSPEQGTGSTAVC